MPIGVHAQSWFVATLLLPIGGSAQILFDGTNGLPGVQGWFYFAIGGAQTPTNGAVLLDTSSNNIYQAGYSLNRDRLNRTNGFTLLFTSELIAEGHANNNRAGFSVIVLADDKRGIELAFWTNTIFAQSDSPLFTHAEDTNVLTTTFVDYALTFHATNYVLAANGTDILSGPVRDYSAFSGFPDPYSSPNFLFFRRRHHIRRRGFAFERGSAHHRTATCGTGGRVDRLDGRFQSDLHRAVEFQPHNLGRGKFRHLHKLPIHIYEHNRCSGAFFPCCVSVVNYTPALIPAFSPEEKVKRSLRF